MRRRPRRPPGPLACSRCDGVIAPAAPALLVSLRLIGGALDRRLLCGPCGRAVTAYLVRRAEVAPVAPAETNHS